MEGAYQFGTNSNGTNHSAGFSTTGIGRKLENRPFTPTVWLYYDYASGEDDFANVARGDNGYDHLFPLAHKYNGFMDLFGRRNLHDLNVLTITPLRKNLSFLLWYHYFSLVEQTTPYSIVLTPYNTTTQATDSELGHEVDMILNWTVNPRTNMLFGYSVFSGGDYYDNPDIGPAGEANDADFFYIQYQRRF